MTTLNQALLTGRKPGCLEDDSSLLCAHELSAAGRDGCFLTHLPSLDWVLQPASLPGLGGQVSWAVCFIFTGTSQDGKAVNLGLSSRLQSVVGVSIGSGGLVHPLESVKN